MSTIFPYHKSVRNMLPELHSGNGISKLKNLWEISRNPSQYQDFPLLKSDFPHLKSDFPRTKSDSPKLAFYFIQRLSAFFNGFLTFFNRFPIFLNGFLLSKKSKKIYLWQEVYKRLLFELRIFCHLLPKLRNFR